MKKDNGEKGMIGGDIEGILSHPAEDHLIIEVHGLHQINS
jgi:hypothetical protein